MDFPILMILIIWMSPRLFWGIESNFAFLFHFLMKIMSANRIAPDGTPRSMASHSVCLCPIKRTLGLYGLIKNKNLTLM